MAVIRKTDWAVNTGPVECDTVNGQAVPVRRVAEPGAVMGDWKCLNGEVGGREVRGVPARVDREVSGGTVRA